MLTGGTDERTGVIGSGGVVPAAGSDVPRRRREGAMKLFIIGPSDNSEGIYSLLTEHGEALAEHWCSSARYARGDLEGHRPERQVRWRERFGEYEVAYLTNETEVEGLLVKNKAWFAALPPEQRGGER